MNKFAAVPLLSLVLSTPVMGAVTETPAAADTIVDVTVFPDRAEVVREIMVDLPRGPSLIEFRNLPRDIERESLRVTARGVEATLGAVEIRERAQSPAETPELLAAGEHVQRLESALAALAAEDETDLELRSFLAALKASTTTRESEKLGEGRVDPAGLQAIYAFVQSGLRDLGTGKVTRAEKRLDLEKTLAVARARLAVLKPAGPIRLRMAAVAVMTSTPGFLTVRLSYLAPGASWRPGYRASLDAATGDVRLDTEALVRQTTGEDWSGVSLRLSTAAPARGVRPPVLTPWLLRPVEIVQGRASGGFAGKLSSDTIDEMVVITSGAAAQYGSARPMSSMEKVAMREEAALVQSSYNLVFAVPGQSEIPSDGTDHLVGLRQDVLRGEVEYHVIPMLNESAFLVVKTKAPASHPLLAGPIHVFAGGAYLGAANMIETGPGGDLTLPFGSDNRILVKRTQLPQERRDAGVMSRDRRIAFGYRTTVENLLNRPATVILEERVPISEDARIEVETGKTTTPGGMLVRDRPGILQWSLRIDPGVKSEVAVDYAVRFPDDIVIAGLQ